MSKICIVLVYVGSIPSYIHHCIQQIRVWSSSTIYIISNDFTSLLDIQSTYINIVTINSDELTGSNIDELNKKKNRFFIHESLEQRKELFYLSCLRTFLVENFMKKYNINNVFHLEIDNLIYFDPEDYSHMFLKNRFCIMLEKRNRGSIGICFIRDWKSIRHYNHMALIYIGKLEWDSEMFYLGRYSTDYPDMVYILPCITFEENINDCPRSHENIGHFNNELFDPAPFGTWIAGTERVHANGNLKYIKSRYNNIDYTKFDYSWKIDSLNRRYPVSAINSTEYKIMNLHVHSKDLQPHMSRRFYIPHNKSVVTGERFQNLCQLFIGSHENMFHNPVFHFDRRWIDIDFLLLNKSLIDNPKYVYVCSRQLSKLEKVIDCFKNPFILVSHNEDANIDERYLDIICNSKVIKMHCQNPLIKHEKMYFLPIGFANGHWPHGNTDIVKKILSEPYKPSQINHDNKVDDVYFFFTVNTNSVTRMDCYNKLLSKGLKWDKVRDYEDYLRTLREHKYAVCPEGNGADCHRIWECILLGVIPIVKNGGFSQILKEHYKIVILDDWSNFDIKNIEISLPRFDSRIFFEDFKKEIKKGG